MFYSTYDDCDCSQNNLTNDYYQKTIENYSKKVNSMHQELESLNQILQNRDLEIMELKAQIHSMECSYQFKLKEFQSKSNNNHEIMLLKQEIEFLRKYKSDIEPKIESGKPQFLPVIAQEQIYTKFIQPLVIPQVIQQCYPPQEVFSYIQPSVWHYTSGESNNKLQLSQSQAVIQNSQKEIGELQRKLNSKKQKNRELKDELKNQIDTTYKLNGNLTVLNNQNQINNQRIGSLQQEAQDHYESSKQLQNIAYHQLNDIKNQARNNSEKADQQFYLNIKYV